MQHRPDALFLVEAHLNEVVSASQRTKMDERVLLFEARFARADRLETIFERTPPRHDGVGNSASLALPAGPRPNAAMGNRALDVAADCRQAIGQFICRQRSPHRRHAASDIHADGGGNDRPLGGNDAAHRCADAVMNVGHDGDVLMNERERREVDQLLPRGILYRHAIGPRLDRRSTLLNNIVHDTFLRVATFSVTEPILQPMRLELRACDSWRLKMA